MRNWQRRVHPAILSTSGPTEVMAPAMPLMPSSVDVVGNHIYFYSEVNAPECSQLMRTIREVDAELSGITRTDSTPIYLHIHSNGGDAFAAFAVADQLMALTTPVYSIVEGLCASAATIISLACDKRLITPSSFMMIHQLSGEMWGNYEQMKDALGMMDMLMENITWFYLERSKVGDDEIKEALKRNSWFNAQRCIEMGFADQVV